MKIAVVGSRTFTDSEALNADLDALLQAFGPFTLVSGGAQGADRLAATWALEHELPLEIHYPDWKRWGRSAGPRRNQLIVAGADRVIAYWDRQSRGTLSSIRFAESLGKPLTIHCF